MEAVYMHVQPSLGKLNGGSRGGRGVCVACFGIGCYDVC